MPKLAPTPPDRTVFYAWQSDAPERQNRYFIRTALQDAMKRVTGTAAAAAAALAPLRYDEATRGLPGSPMIADAILAKIDSCEVVVGDISVINPHEQDGRRFPNPNVAFETGWAAARLGWGRVLLVFNTATGTIETDVPFDLRGRLLVPYTLDVTTPLNSPSAKAIRDQLTGALAAKLESALDSPAPVRPKAASKRAVGLSAQQQRERDRAALYEMLGVIDSRWVDGFLDNLADERIPDSAEARLLRFAGVVRQARFHLFDAKTRTLVFSFADAWDRVYAATMYGDSVVNTRYAKFRPESYMSGREIDQARREFHDARAVMQKCFRALVTRIHQAYPEFDLRQSDERAREAYEAL